MSNRAPNGELPENVDAFLFIQTEKPQAGAINNTTSAFRDSVAAKLKASAEPRILSTRVAHQAFTSISPSGADLRSLRHDGGSIAFERSHNAEVVYLPGASIPRPLQLAVFDMDSTLIDQEVIDELARTIGKTDQVAAITESAMRGELDFSESLKARVAMLKGVRADIWDTLKGCITLAPGAKEMCKVLKEKGVKTAVFSGGFQPMADWLKEQLGLDVAVANHLLISPPTPEFPYAHLTGELDPGYPIISAAKKRELLISLAEEFKAPLSQTLCVGDGANDLDMLNATHEGGGLAVACRAKPKVQREAPNRLNNHSLTDLIYLFE